MHDLFGEKLAMVFDLISYTVNLEASKLVWLVQPSDVFMTA